jgi:Zn-dependent M32 family carboxypeptidase
LEFSLSLKKSNAENHRVSENQFDSGIQLADLVRLFPILNGRIFSLLISVQDLIQSEDEQQLSHFPLSVEAFQEVNGFQQVVNGFDLHQLKDT